MTYRVRRIALLLVVPLALVMGAPVAAQSKPSTPAEKREDSGAAAPESATDAADAANATDAADAANATDAADAANAADAADATATTDAAAQAEAASDAALETLDKRGATAPAEAAAEEAPPSADTAPDGAPSATVAATPFESSDAHVADLTRIDASGEPAWVAIIRSGNYRPLYPGSDGSGYIGVGMRRTREEAVAAAAVDFAGNVSTVVEAGVRQRETNDGATSRVDVAMESEVRTQAIISSLSPLVFQASRTEYFALYLATVDEYDRALADWTRTMESVSEAQRQQEYQRLEDERLAAERALQQEQVAAIEAQRREAARAELARRFAPFNTHDFPTRFGGVPTTGVRDGADLGFIYRWAPESTQAAGASLDLSFGQFIVVALDGYLRWGDGLTGQSDGHVFLRLINSAGSVTAVSLAAGAWGGADFPGDGSGGAEWGPFVAFDLFTPRLLRTQWGVYAGTDRVQGRLHWYPLFGGISDAIGFHVAYQVPFAEARFTDPVGTDRALSAGVSFRPAREGRVLVEWRDDGSITTSLVF